MAKSFINFDSYCLFSQNLARRFGSPESLDSILQRICVCFQVVSCEVIRDHKTGDSLQYAFVEFDDQKACENAYFKMDNVLIDDRRIHVDFSQSVSKYKWKGKGRLEVLEDGKNKNKERNNDKRGDHKVCSHKSCFSDYCD